MLRSSNSPRVAAVKLRVTGRLGRMTSSPAGPTRIVAPIGASATSPNRVSLPETTPLKTYSQALCCVRVSRRRTAQSA